MATITYFTDRNYAPRNLANQFCIGARVDFSVGTGKPCASADVVQAVNIPAGTVVKNIWVKLITAEGATCTAKVGDGSDDDGFDVSTNLNTTVGTITYGIAGTDAYISSSIGTSQGKIYTVADTIDLTLGNAASTAVVEVYVEGFTIGNA